MYISYTFINHIHIYIDYGAPSLCYVQLFATPWTVARQAPLSMAGIVEWVPIPFSSRSS